ncbi:MAG: EAL domain-containing protein [Desulfuromonadales bacterium]|nr:EAL domain-containing protein [Desulfuromonadales bacterium]
MIDQSGTSPHRFSRPLVAAAIVFLLVTLLAAMLVWRLDHLRLQKDRTRVASLTGDYANALQRNIERALSATYALAAMVRQGNGHFPNFDEIALQMLPLYPGADSLQLAPGGVTRQIVPLAGNEKGIGRNLLTDPLRNKEALLARESGKLTLAGPFDLIQGGTGVVGRFPVFLDNEAGHKFFWGFTSIVLRFPDILDTAGLPRLTDQGFAYELWRVHPDSGERQIITASAAVPLNEPVEQVLELPNGIWTLSVVPVKGWGSPLGLSAMASLGLMFSLLLSYLTKLLVESKNHEARLEGLVVERTAKIREGEERLRLLEDNLPDSYVFQYLHEEDGTPRFLYLSAGVEKLHGLSRQVVQGDAGALYRQIDLEQTSDLKEAIGVSAKNLTDFQMDLHACRADGECRWLKVRARPQRRADRRVVWDGVVSDVTVHKQTEDEVRKSAARYRELFEVNPHPMWVYDLESLAFLAVNDAAISHYGYSQDEFLAMTIRDIRPPEDVPKLLENISKVSHGVDEAGAWWHCKKDGSLILVEITSHTLSFDGHPAELVLAHDITERYRAESALRESEERLNLFIEHAPAALAMFDREMRYLAVSQRWLVDYGLREKDIIGHSHYEIFPEIEEKWKTAHCRGLAGEVLCADEDRFKRADGTFQWVRWEIRPWHAADGSVGGIVIFSEDITERKIYEEKLMHLATHDELTGLANRPLLLDRLEQSLHYARRSGCLVGVLLFDLDRFKVINDSLGHAFGDKLLCSLAKRLMQLVREADTVARLGGDEFVILLAEVAEPEDVGLVASKILQHLAKPFWVDNREILVTASLGISLYPKDSDEGATLIRNADMAMYRAKKNKRNSFAFYSPEMNQRILETLELEGGLRQALERKEFCLHYQPQVDLGSGHIVGCEALVRWQHPQRGMVPPDNFIPLAEETGLIVPLGTWVLRESCRQAREWQEQGLSGLSVAVNISGRQFREPDFVATVERVLQESGLEPQFLELEITESVMMENVESAIMTWADLKLLGVSLAIDDFGTGYSSLSYLKQFPIHSLKIDRSFVCDIVTDSNDAAIASSVIALAHTMGLKVVGEGIETEEQLQFLKEKGCNMGQGYLFSRPLPAEEIVLAIKSKGERK